MLIRKAYRQKIEQLGLVCDPAQRRVVDIMQDLQERLSEDARPLARMLRTLRLAGDIDRPRGLYLWGGVGRGKTFLMDLFFQTLPFEKKRRVHFHRLMGEVHARSKGYRNTEDPLDRIAGDIAKNARVLCFDEFFVSDIGDAMILGRLVHGLFRRGVVLVATSNSAPRELYAGGLQRERFLPAIEHLERHTRVVDIGGTTDYRLRLLDRAGTYMCPAGQSANARLDEYFNRLASGPLDHEATVTVLGREIAALKRAKGVAWFSFEALCEGPRSQQDYIEIARWYPAVIVSDVPRLTAARENAARRFISLVDEFYDRRVKLILSAEAAIAELYTGSRLAFEFERTASRLVEMQTKDYLHSGHLG